MSLPITKLLQKLFATSSEKRKVSRPFIKSFEYAHQFFMSAGGKQFLSLLGQTKKPIILIDFWNMVKGRKFHGELAKIKNFRLSRLIAYKSRLKIGQSKELAHYMDIIYNFVAYLGRTYPNLLIFVVLGDTYAHNNELIRLADNVYEVNNYRPTHYETDDVIIVAASIALGSKKHCILSRDFYKWADPALFVQQRHCMMLLHGEQLVDIVDVGKLPPGRCHPLDITC
jgi:hypothetical protein